MTLISIREGAMGERYKVIFRISLDSIYFIAYIFINK